MKESLLSLWTQSDIEEEGDYQTDLRSCVKESLLSLWT